MVEGDVVTPLVAAAGAQIFRRVAVYIVAAALVLAGWWYIQALRHEAAEARSLRQTIVAERRNGERAVRLMAEASRRERIRAGRVRVLEEEIRRAKKAVPAACRPMLAPLERALDGVRELRGERGGATPARPVVPSRPAPTRYG